MEFRLDHPILYVMVAIIVAAVLGQSIYFLVKALRRAKEIGMDKKVIKSTVTSSAIFTIAPAVAILVGVIVLSKSLGVALPWLRLSVIGSLSYETVASQSAISELGLSSGTPISNANDYVTVVWVMTVGIILGLLIVPFFTKRIQGGINKIGMKDKKWGEIFNSAMFLGMISAFSGYVVSHIDRLWTAVNGEVIIEAGKKIVDGKTEKIYETVSATSGLIPVCVMLVSAVVMAACGILAKKCKIRWLTDYALPLSLVSGMASAIPFTALLG